ncbi:MAG: septal ring lytic transglycosylase RlpA family protein [Saprospiraceae bacterium]
MRHFLTFLLCAAFLPTLIAQAYQSEVGKAGFYADKFQGQPTASGALYDKKKLTCAHNQLPFGTRIRVTNLENQKSVVVEVNDTGPFKEGFIVDLSRAAAEAIGMVRAGVVRVRIELTAPLTAPLRPRVESPGGQLSPEAPRVPSSSGIQIIRPYNDGNSARPGAAPPSTGTSPGRKGGAPDSTYPPEPQPLQPPTKSRELYQLSIKRPFKEGYAVQVGVMTNLQIGMQEADKLAVDFPDMVLVLVESDLTIPEATARPLFKVMIGPYYDKASAEKARVAAVKKGYKKPFVVNITDI